MLALIGCTLLVRGKQHHTLSAEEQLAADTRAPVVYLRSFAADSKTAEAGGGEQPIFEGWVTEEEHLAAVLNQVGPVIAVGRPGEDLPKVGAARLYITDWWQGHVERQVGANYGKLLQLYGVHKATAEARKKVNLRLLKHQLSRTMEKLLLARKVSGKPVISQIIELVRLRYSQSGISPSEYFNFELYKTGNWTSHCRLRHAPNAAHLDLDSAPE